ncbi:MAG: cytochrome c [Aquificae bacterium]|nr:cytochrome c [Aquificota bacterium]
MRKVLALALLSLPLFAAGEKREKTQEQVKEQVKEQVQERVRTGVNEELMKKGYEVFKKHCQACHVEYASPEKMREIVAIIRSGGKPPIAAPPMNEVAARVKHFFPEEEDFIEFVVDYITEPSREKGLCKPKAFEVFGVMPPIGKSLSEEEKRAVAYWMYHRYQETWEEMMRHHRPQGKGKGPKWMRE